MQFINDPNGPAPHGPYSQAVRSGNLLYTSGQVPFDSATGELVGKNIAEQTDCTMKNLAQTLAAANLKLENIVKVTVYLKNWDDFGEFNKVYGEHLNGHKPARATVEVAGLVPGCLIEIEAIAEFSA